MQIVEVIEDVRAEPRLAGRRLALKRERPVRDAGFLRDETRRLVELILVRIALGENARRQRVRGEDHVPRSSAHAVRNEVDERRKVVPALDEAKLRAIAERLLELRAIAGDRELGVVRREHEPDDEVGAARDGTIGRVRDARSPVLHPGEHRQPELAFQSGTRLLGQRVQRIVLLDAERAVAGDEIVEVLGRDRPPTADVRVVGGDVLEPLGRPVCHQDDGSAHGMKLAESSQPATSS